MPRARLNGVDIRYSVSGRGQPLLLIQGLGAPGSSWIFQRRFFSRHFCVVTFDNRGVGRSEKPREHYTVRTMADDAVCLLDHLGIERSHVLGVSMGGMIAQELAINYPQRVNRLVLACTTAGLQDADERMEQQRNIGLGDGSAEVELEGLDANKMGQVMRNITACAFNRRLFRLLLVPPAQLYFRSVGVVEGIVGQLWAVADYSTLDRLSQIQAPTLVIAGTGDRIIAPHSSEVLASGIDGAELIEFDGGSHSFFMEMHGRFNAAVLDFLRGG